MSRHMILKIMHGYQFLYLPVFLLSSLGTVHFLVVSVLYWFGTIIKVVLMHIYVNKIIGCCANHQFHVPAKKFLYYSLAHPSSIF